MDSTSGGEKEGGDSEATSSLGAESLHDHSDLLIPNPSFISSPASVSSSTSSMMMGVTSPTSVNSDNDLHNKQLMDCQMTSPNCGEDGARDGQLEHYMFPPSQPDSSPPNVIVDDSPLQPCMDRNKQSLKVKLLMRRPMNQLVEQGILPPPKTPAAFAGQRVRLERARMGDFLKAKIQQRPARQELIRQHILEDTDSRVAPSLAEKQRMLKRARLADSLNDHLIHRPGPLELVQKNILHAPDADIEQAIKDGIVSFKATSEGHVPGPSLPCKYTVNEDDSSSDISSPAGTPDASSSGYTTEANTPISKQSSDPAICLPSPAPAAPTTVACAKISEPCDVTLQPAKTNKSETAVTQPAPAQLILATPKSLAGRAQQLAQATTIFQVTPATAAVIPPPPPLPTSSTVTTIPPPPPLPQTIVLSDGAVRELLPQLQSAGFQLAAAHVQKSTPSQSSLSSSFGKSRSSKKSSKSKSQPKARTIKFHEYKGPSSCGGQKSSSSSSSGAGSSSSAQSSAESSYELLLKQQQLFLQWQLEWQHKYPQILLPAAPKPAPGSHTTLGSGSTATLSSFPVTAIPASLCTHLLSNQQTSSQQSAPSPATITIASSMSNDASPRPITLAPKMTEIAPKPPEMSSESKTGPGPNDSVPSPASSTSSTLDRSTSVKSLNLSNIGEWKVNDLKAELKKRSLPVSGSKSQLVERLKAAAAKESSHSNGNKPVSVKMEVSSADENSNEGMMDTGNNATSEEASSDSKSRTQPTAMIIGGSPAPQPQQQQSENNNVSILDLANGKLNGVPISLQNLLTLLGVSTSDGNVLLTNNNNPTADNNLKNFSAASGVIQAAATTTAKVISQLPISTVVSTAAKAAAAAAAASNAETSTTTSNNKLVDEKKILEQQNQILELQKALSISQQQLQQLAQQKDPKHGGPQKHRLVLQQHIQQKLRQQAIQNQLQNLIQLQTQQADQKKQLLQQQQQQQQLQTQAQPQLVLISSNNNNNNQTVTSLGNSILPVTVVSQAPQQQHQHQQVDLSNHWIPQQQNEGTRKPVTSTTVSLSFDDLVKNIETKSSPKMGTEAEARKRSVKSQMVDDVLEILIRNGELPPSAAQDPHAKTHTPPSSTTTSSTSSVTSNATAQAPPPPPPLPPPSFSVMLPTSIPFSRHHSTSNTDFLTLVNLGGRTGEHLSKDAQEILRICEDLSNFGKSREAEAAQAAANAKLENGNMGCGFFTDAGGPNAPSHNKDFDLSINHNSSGGNADSMDIGFGDTHSVSLHSTGSKPQHIANHQYHNSPFDSGTFSFGHTNAQSQPHQHNSFSKSPHDHHPNFMTDDDLLPVSLDMQMDTDYSDWLDTLLPDSGPVNNSSATSNPSTANLFQHHQLDATVSGNKMNSEKGETQLFNHNNNLSNSNSQNSSSNGSSLFGSLLDEHPHQQQQQQQHGQQRVPLLSSRSFVARENNSSPFIGDISQQQNNFLFSPHHNHHQQHPLLIFHNPSSVGSTSSTATMMDTDFDELTAAAPTTTNTKKSENILSASSHNNIITEMPSTTSNIITAPIITTTSSINDNFLWDFAM